MRFHIVLSAVVLALLTASCANPIGPTGGPVDERPPVIESSEPAIDAVNYRGDRVLITFSEYINEPSFLRALTVTPAQERAPEVRWHGRTAELRFREPLRENTTYLLTLDNTLRDFNGVALKSPITLAFSTGPQINRGRLSGRVVEPVQGTGVGGVDVYAYVVADSAGLSVLPDRPDYRTQTDDQGRFQFTYIGETSYAVLGITDRNRNRRPDAGEPVATPPRAAIAVDTTSVPSGVWFLATSDTTQPQVQRVRALSNNRLEVRYAEPVTAERGGWALADSATGREIPLRFVYQRRDQPRSVFIETEALPAARYRISAGEVRDSTGNPGVRSTTGVNVPVAPDTAKLAFLGFGSIRGAGDAVRPVPGGALAAPVQLAPDEYPAVSLTLPLPDTARARRIQVVDTSGTSIPYRDTTSNGTTYQLMVDTTAGVPFEVHVSVPRASGPDSTYVRSYRQLPERELGALSGFVRAESGTAVQVELYPAEKTAVVPIRTIHLEQAGRFTFSGLPAATYRLRAVGDRNRNQRWDGGRMAPWQPAEPLDWSSDSLRVRVRWENVVADTLNLIRTQ